MNTQTILQDEGDGLTETAEADLRYPPEEHFDQAIAACSRLLLGGDSPGHDLQTALTQLAFGFDARHVALFQIESYHTEDNRGRWIACSKADTCPYCKDSRDWDYIRLIDDDMRMRLEGGQSCSRDVRNLPHYLAQGFYERGVARLIIVPLTVLGKWWGFLCIEALQADIERLPVEENHLKTVGALFSVFYERQHVVEGFHERKELSGALEMAGTVCHKLNQPMQVILGYASMVTSGDINEKEQIIEIVQLIEDETRQMGIITKNLMGITKNREAE